jgi:hypothetical protein
MSRGASTGQWSITGEHPGGINGGVDATFNPHGFDRNGPTGTTLVTADYLVMSSTWADVFRIVTPM